MYRTIATKILEMSAQELAHDELLIGLRMYVGTNNDLTLLTILISLAKSQSDFVLFCLGNRLEQSK